MNISFHGAAGTVTGSRHLVEAENTRVLVDAGLFIEFALESFPRLQAMAGEATRHGRLEDLRVHWEGSASTQMVL